MLEGTVEVANRLGLHLRAATKLAETARTFQSKVTIVGKDGQADARSVINLMMLGAAIGSGSRYAPTALTHAPRSTR